MGYASGAADRIVVRSINIIDGTGGPASGPSTVVIEGGRIVSVRPDDAATVPTPAPIEIDGAGRVMMPGLIETHAHYEDWMGEALLLNGVTTILDTGALFPLDWTFAQRDGSRDGRIFGPRMLVAGPVIHGPVLPEDAWRFPAWHPTAASPGEARTAALQLVEAGVDCLKAYLFLTPESIGAIAEVAEESGLPSMGHINVSSLDAARRGLRAIAHGSGLIEAVVPQDVLAPHGRLAIQRLGTLTPAFVSWFTEADDHLVDETIDELIQLGTYLEPDMIHTGGRTAGSRVEEYELEDYRFFDDPRKEYIPASFTTEITRLRAHTGWTALDADALARATDGLARLWSIYGEFHRRGGRLLVASGQGHLVPGVSMHRELELMVDIGLSPIDAIHGATGLAAEYLKRSDIGTIAEGKVADLVILDADPTKDIRATRSISHVIQHGRIVELEYHPWHANPIPSPPREFLFGRGLPTIDSLTPSAVPAGQAAELTVRGSYFVQGSHVRVDGRPVPTTFVDSGHLIASVPATCLGDPHLADVTAIRPEPSELGRTSRGVPWVVSFPEPDEDAPR